MRILICIGSLDPLSGGPPKVAVGHALALARRGDQPELLTLESRNGSRREIVGRSELLNAGITVSICPRSSPGVLGLSRNAAEFAHAKIGSFDVVHLHGVWEMLLATTARLARRADVPYVVAPHGMLDRWSRNRSWLKKALAMRLLGTGALLNEAAAVQFGTEAEAKEAADMQLPAKVCVIPNGIDSASIAKRRNPSDSELLRQFPELSQAYPVILFFSRMHPKKGVDLLLEAFARAAAHYPRARLLIAAIPQDDAYLRGMITRSRRPDLVGRCVITTDFVGERGRQAMDIANVFALPSHQEGFSMSLLEAMASGLPALITDQCHMDDIQAAGVGVVVSPNVDALERGLRQFLACSPSQLNDMGKRAQQFVISEYSWSAIGERLSEMYHSLKDNKA